MNSYSRIVSNEYTYFLRCLSSLNFNKKAHVWESKLSVSKADGTVRWAVFWDDGPVRDDTSLWWSFIDDDAPLIPARFGVCSAVRTQSWLLLYIFFNGALNVVDIRTDEDWFENPLWCYWVFHPQNQSKLLVFSLRSLVSIRRPNVHTFRNLFGSNALPGMYPPFDRTNHQPTHCSMPIRVYKSST